MSNAMLDRAVNSVARQTLQPEWLHVYNDKERHGAGRSRQQLLAQVTTEWVAWIDSDDEWLPDHLEKLFRVATETDSVYVYSWFHGSDPLGHMGIPFDPCRPHHTTMGILERTDIATEAGFCETQEAPYSNEDWFHMVRFAKICCERNLKMTHLPEKTWFYHQAGQNSSGRPGQGDA
jgi:hypothetical protein